MVLLIDTNGIKGEWSCFPNPKKESIDSIIEHYDLILTNDDNIFSDLWRAVGKVVVKFADEKDLPSIYKFVLDEFCRMEKGKLYQIEINNQCELIEI